MAGRPENGELRRIVHSTSSPMAVGLAIVAATRHLPTVESIPGPRRETGAARIVALHTAISLRY
jgi:hypothetical protein